MIFCRLRSAISSAPSPSHPLRISSVCCPSGGGGRRPPAASRPSLTGLPRTVRGWPVIGWGRGGEVRGWVWEQPHLHGEQGHIDLPPLAGLPPPVQRRRDPERTGHPRGQV